MQLKKNGEYFRMNATCSAWLLQLDQHPKEKHNEDVLQKKPTTILWIIFMKL